MDFEKNKPTIYVLFCFLNVYNPWVVTPEVLLCATSDELPGVCGEMPILVPIPILWQFMLLKKEGSNKPQKIN